MKTHRIKIWPSHYEAVLSGEKRAELRRNDRDYAVGDELRLCEFDPGYKYRGRLTGREHRVRVTHVIHGSTEGLDPYFVVLSIAEAGDE